MIFSLKNLSNIIPALKSTVLRFPLPLFCVISATVIVLLLFHDSEYIKSVFEETFIFKSLASLVYGAIALTSLKLFAESKNWSVVSYLVGAAVTTMVIIGYVWAIIVDVSASTYVFFSIAVILSLMFAPYIKRSSDSASIWYFNYQTGVAIFFAGLASTILGIGLSLIVVSVEYLFEIEIPDKIFGDVWIFSWGILFSIYLLSSLAREFDYEDESCGFPKGVSFITNYILVPLMFAYMFILYAYFIKITVQWELPRGNLGWMITIFGSVGIITKLLAYPIRNQGTRLLALFDKYYYYALIVPILLLVIALGVRINDYGITEPRYGVALLGVWFSSVILLTFIKKENVNIKHVPMILATLAILASFGPWGAANVSLNSQANLFEKILTKHQLLVNGQVIKSTTELPLEDRKTLSSIADYLSQRDKEKNRIKPLFKTLLAEAGSKDGTSPPLKWGKDYLNLMGVIYINRVYSDPNSDHFTYTIKTYTEHIMVDTSGFDFVGHDTFYLHGDNTTTSEFKMHYGDKHEVVTVEFDGQFFIVKTEAGDTVKLDLSILILELRKEGSKISVVDTEKKRSGRIQLKLEHMNKLILTQRSKEGSFKIRLLLEEVRGKITGDSDVKITNIKYVLMFERED